MGKLKDTCTHAHWNVCERVREKERIRWIWINFVIWMREQECVLEIHFMLMLMSTALSLSRSIPSCSIVDESNWVFCVREQFFVWYRIDLISFVDVFIIGVVVVVADVFSHTSMKRKRKTDYLSPSNMFLRMLQLIDLPHLGNLSNGTACIQKHRKLSDEEKQYQCYTIWIIYWMNEAWAQSFSKYDFSICDFMAL